MPREADVRRMIAEIDRILPGRPAPENEPDERWQVMIQLGDHIKSHPEPIWAFAAKWGKHAQPDLRTAVATILLEHLLEHHFTLIYPRVQAAVKKSKRFADTLRQCYWMGEAAFPANARRLDRLAGKKRPRLPRINV